MSEEYKGPIVYEMKELMKEIINDSCFSKTEQEVIDDYFNDFYEFVNTKSYKYCIDDNGFVIRKDCHANVKSIYGWIFENNVPKAIISKVDLKKTKIDIRSNKSVYKKIYNELDLNLDDWLND